MTDTNSTRRGKRQLVVVMDRAEAELVDQVAELEGLSRSTLTRRALAEYCRRALDTFTGQVEQLRAFEKASKASRSSRPASSRSAPASGVAARQRPGHPGDCTCGAPGCPSYFSFGD